MKSKKTKILVVVLVVIIALLTIRVVFDSKFDDFQNMVQWQKDYKIEHPEATKDEIDQAFKDSMKGIEEWIEKYKVEHPDATDAEINRAFNEAWGN